MIKSIVFWYLLYILPTVFLILSMCASVELRKVAPILGTPSEVKDNITYGNLIVALILGLIPFLNIFGTIVLVVFIIINLFIWLCNSPTLARKPFAKKQWTSLTTSDE